jgi:rhodanese-related sulfurtransferase
MKELHASEFQKLLENSKEALHILDVRTPAEYHSGHIPGSVLIDIMDVSFQDKVAELPKEEVYYVVCRSGNRSATACRFMEQMGFTDTTNITGGMLDWEGEVE